MTSPTRRNFLQATSTAAASLSLASYVHHAGAADAKKPLSVALIGCGGRGSYLAGVFQSNPGVSLSWVCDVDTGRLKRGQKLAREKVKTSDDIRKVLADDTLDAVIVATPDHWHSPAAILACEAGKHVYVEKPCSHNVREGRLLVEAARRNKRVVQHGTQVRSTTMMIDAVKLLRDGIIGDVKVCKAWNIQRRGNIGKGKPGSPPTTLDYDNWVGPAEFIPYQANRTPSGWHWWYHFGTGDMGNDGVHDIDYARWGLGVDKHPSMVSASGGKFFFDDDQQFPDTQQVAFQYPGSGATGDQKLLMYEQRLWSTNYPHNVDSGAEFYGTKGQMFLSRRGKIAVYGERNRRIDVKVVPEAQNAEKHVRNFLHCVRTGQVPNGDIELGHLTTSLCHLGNVATRLGRSFRFDPDTERVLGDAEADNLMSRPYRNHWGRPKGA
ncbi:MAG: dehydrogenase [Planctomycetaceae bacterium]|nr:dehydrogenase [Planctomycetaceae bacterium]|tara:strand:+ start:332 stop:1642 length:1311 start_codon:yes stop_codon:yes gene_type:complete